VDKFDGRGSVDQGVLKQGHDEQEMWQMVQPPTLLEPGPLPIHSPVPHMEDTNGRSARCKRCAKRRCQVVSNVCVREVVGKACALGEWCSRWPSRR
jgi:hypothetical protein